MDEPLFNELLESVKQADQIMSDHAELRRLAKRADALHGTPSLEHIFAITKFREAVEPKAILALLDEIDGMKASGWRNHSVNYARAEKCPQTLETAQAAWDRDQELIEEQRQQIARDSQTINQLRQKLQSAEVDRDRLKAENETLRGALHAVQAEVDGNLRPLTRDLVNMVSGLNNGTHPNDIYDHCDEIERIIGAALEGAKP
ncbi:hypothetical protein [Pseudomonas aeruginosa]|uniref:Uncharacterized protein n=1 Tax=Pseudomonas phage D3 TaxID=2932880 RepID=Q9MC65_BPD3|nr:hypothetical protein [Pseudomonas aeruginosa]NP_061553.1 hypothetical protein D3p061 [Pseudomonas phage D3]AAF80816.1 hypothetical protein [Pseudomonas phage D3]QUI41150.1 hypothetical protein I3251_03030 [Pseudomonas aeruginosa]QUI49220.1 hypothetical protein JBL36_23740 [Pseudomonas aeruginosa]QUI58914.1 hypothetical protein JBL37_11100 [Pseudomonas aeruginosa]